MAHIGVQINSFGISDQFLDECGENLTGLCKKDESVDEYGFLVLKVENRGLVVTEFGYSQSF